MARAVLAAGLVYALIMVAWGLQIVLAQSAPNSDVVPRPIADRFPAPARDQPVLGKAAAVEPADDAALLDMWRGLAEEGDAKAQLALGRLYEEGGGGVAQDDSAAVLWYRLAAAQGQPNAQFNLGVRYVMGRGVPQDDVLAHMWFALAAAQGSAYARSNRDILAERMTPMQTAKAKQLARDWLAARQP